MPKTGHFILHSNVIPKLTAGAYDLVTEQTGLPFSVAPEHTHIVVASPRYTMPTDQILSTFPPANGEGAYGDRLPQIVLKRRTLPWERNPAEVTATSTTPWLALVVVAEGEAQLSATTPVAQCVTPGTTLLDAATDQDVDQSLYLAVTETGVKKIFPCKADLERLVHVREVDINDTELANGDDDGWLAVVLANRLPVFDVAKNAPVRYMACLVNVEGQLDALPPPVPPQKHFAFELAQDWSVLAAIDPNVGPDPRVMGGVSIGNVVLPAMQRGAAPRAVLNKTVAAKSATVGAALDGAAGMKQTPASKQWQSATEKVSAAALDPDAKRLVRDTMAGGFRYPIEQFAIERVLRFPVLAHWSFTTTDGATFETLMQDLDVGLLGSTPPVADPPKPTAPEVVQTGHIGLDHRSRRGDPMRAWYRGPCVPFPTLRDGGGEQALPLAHSADQLRRVVPDGREDLALAAGFEIGRLLALSQLSIVSALLRFRGEQFGAGRVHQLLTALMPFEIPKLVDERLDLGRYVALQMVGQLAKNPQTMLGPRRPVADPGRELKVSGDLDAVIAGGLGLDLAALRKTGEQIGMLAALARSDVPLAAKNGDLPFDKATLNSLRGALATELNRALQVAAPPVVLRGRGASAAPDALDELIARADASFDEEGPT